MISKRPAEKTRPALVAAQTQTLATAPFLLRARRDTDELACIAVSFKYSRVIPVTKWVDIVLVNVSDREISNLTVTAILASHTWGYVTVLDKSFLLARRLRPLEDCLFTLPLTMDYLNVWMTTTFEQQGKSRTIKHLVQEYPDADDLESHGVYNLLESHSIDTTFSSQSTHSRKVALHETMNLVANDPDLLHRTSPDRFEAVVGALFEKQGFRVQHVGRTGDGGVDLIAVGVEDVAPRKILVQCKRYKGKVGVAPVRELYGVKTNLRATQAILVTTGGYTRAAKALAEKNCWELSLIDFEVLKALLGERFQG